MEDQRAKVYQFKPLAGNLSKLSFGEYNGVRGIENCLAPSSVETLPVTLDRVAWVRGAADSLVFLTYGAPELAAVLPATAACAESKHCPSAN